VETVPHIETAIAKYSALLLDPPWDFRCYSDKGITNRSAATKYKVAPLDQLKQLPIGDYAAKHCVMFMWIIDSHLEQAIDLMKAYGFVYKTVAFVWVKTTNAGQPVMSMGHWTRKGVELCLLGTRGQPHRVGKGVRQVILAPRREHSRKPEEIYEKIEALVDGPYAEAFSRQQRAGWDQIVSNEGRKFNLLSDRLISFGGGRADQTSALG
jgi:N6-adenosine-specific RNA methylase IME4